MMVLVSAVLLILTVFVLGTAGGPLVRRAAPALMRTPRLAAGVLMLVLGAWLLAVAAIGPMLAWTLSGPTEILPGNTGDVCQRCLDAANPLPPGVEINTVVPVILLLAVPLFLAGVMVAAGDRFRRRRRAELKVLSQTLPCETERVEVGGHWVTLVQGTTPVAFALPKRRCGIVISSALIEVLTEQELRAVLTHEAAHLNQRHHLILGLLKGGVAPLRWIPLISAIVNAVPHYLEMAADNAAREQTSTPALASALLKIGQKPASSPEHPATSAVALHAAGTDRIRHLVAPPMGRRGLAPTAVILGAAGLLLASGVAVHLPYLGAVLGGCLL